MSHLHYLIKNCSAKDFESACPKHWDKLKPAFSDVVRHCDHCNKKVYLCETDEQIKFYTSVKFCIAVAQPEGLLNVEGNTPSSLALVFQTVESTAQHDERPSSSQMQRLNDDSDIPAFLRTRSK